MNIHGKIDWDSLWECEDAWRLLVKNIPDIIMTVDRNGEILSLNRAISDFSQENIIGKKIYDYISPLYCDTLKKYLVCAFQKREANDFIALGSGPQGPNSAWYETRVVPVEREKKVVAAILICRNITKRKTAEDELKKSEQRFRLSFENAADTIFWADINTGKIIKCNKAAEALLERKTEEIIGMHQTMLHPPQKREFYRRQFKEHIEKGKVVNDYAEIITKSGRIKPVHVTAAVTTLGEQVIIQGIFRDVSERNDTEKALLESEEKYRTLVENVNIGVYRNTGFPNGRFLHANPDMAKIFGYKSVGEFLKIKVSDLYQNPQDREVFIKEVLSKGFVKGRELRLRRKDGAPIWCSCTARVQYNENGGIKWMDGAIEDITERKRIEQALQESEGNYSSLVEQAQEGVAVLQDGVFKFCNKAMSIITGYPKNELIGADFLPAILPEYRELVKKRYAADIEGKTSPKTFEIKTRHKGGSIIDIEVTGSTISYQNRPAAMCVLRDITARKQAEEALRQSEEKYRTLLKNIPQKIFYKDVNSVYVLCNKAFAEDLHLKPEQMIGATDYDFFPRELAEKYRADDRRIMQSGETEEIEEKYLVDGREVIVCTFKAPLRGENGKIIGIFGIFWDITAHKQAEEKICESEGRYRAIFEQAADAILIIDPKTGALLDFNDKAHRQLGYTADEFKKLTISDLEIIETREEVSRHLNKIAREGSDVFETKQRTKSGEIRDILVAARAISIHGRSYLQSICRDITDGKRARIELEKLNKELLRSNKKLKQLSLKDIHTGLFNHRFLEEAVEAEFYRAKRYGHALSVVMLDIDYFKSINDVYGHHFGDLVLRQFAKLLKRMVRRYDIVIRSGGEEFIILCPGVDRASVLILAQRALDAVNLYNFGNKKHSVKLKLSIAVASYPEDRLYRAMDLIELTERILNRAKESGGNRTCSSLDINKGKQPAAEIANSDTDIAFLREKIDKLTARSNQNLIEAVFAFAKTIELKDRYTGEHVERMVRYSTGIARALELSKDEIEQIRQASVLHDLGKIGISEKILLKKSQLNKKEFAEIKQHPQIGVDIIRPIHFLHIIIPLILYHHERWDGRGYPNGLKGEEIPIGARIIAVADVFEALTSNRPYRKAYSKGRAVNIIKTGAGGQFDPGIVNIFLKVLQKQEGM